MTISCEQCFPRRQRPLPGVHCLFFTGLFIVNILAMGARTAAAQNDPDRATATPIHHVVVIFQENVSFDHYFATYPVALNPPGEPAFHAVPNTPSLNGLSEPLIVRNPNSTKPFRLDRADALTCDNNNGYAAEQRAVNHGLADKYPENTSADRKGCTPALAMGYYDGNTVTALWNYAQRFALSDNFFDTEFGTTVMGHLNLVSGQTHQSKIESIPGKIANGSIIGNTEAQFDDCSKGTLVPMEGRNVGDLLNEKGVSWGWFYGEFGALDFIEGKPLCKKDYNSHYDPFQYWRSTANPHHLPPTSAELIGKAGDQANHQYDLDDLWKEAATNNLSAVIFIKSHDPETGHPEKSDPLREQTFLVETINRLQMTKEWSDMVIFIAYDDSDGWYDHVVPPIVNGSSDAALDSFCAPSLPDAFQDRCGYGERLPILAISPFAKVNYVDHTTTDQTSILRFIEDNWALGHIDPPETPDGKASFDRIAGSLNGMFDFVSPPRVEPLILDKDSGLVLGETK